MLANHDLVVGPNREAAKKIGNEIVQMAHTQSSKNYTCLPVVNGSSGYSGGYMNSSMGNENMGYDSYSGYENGYPKMGHPQNNQYYNSYNRLVYC